MKETKLSDIIEINELRTKIRETYKYNKNEIKGNFILTSNAEERIQKLYNQLQSNIPIMLEGPTGTSKTKTVLVVCELLKTEPIRINLSSETTIEDLMGKLTTDKDNSFSGFTYKKGSFAEAYSEGKILLLDEVNLAPNPILQCMLSALDSDEITQYIPGVGLKKFKRHPNFRMIATQNPKTGSFVFTRDRLSNKFLETFQVIEFPEFGPEELSEIARGEAIKFKYIKEDERGSKKSDIIKQIGQFHNEWVKSNLSKESPQCYTVRDINYAVKAISENKSTNEVINCFYGARYEKKIFEQMQNILKKNYPDLFEDLKALPNLPKDFPKCFQSKALRQAFQFAKLGIESGKHLLFVGKEEIGLTQIAQWISYYFSNKKNENFIFTFTPEITVSDLLGRYILANESDSKSKNKGEKINEKKKKEESIGNIMSWKDGPLTEAITNGSSCVFTNISSAQTKVAERLNGLFDPKESDQDYKFDLYENSEKKQIDIHKDFHFISTCNIDKLKYLSPALLNRMMVINIADQLEGLKEKDFLELITIILENEYKEEIIDKSLVNLIYEKQKEKNYTMSKLAKFAKSVYKLYKECDTKIDKIDIINYIDELLFGDKDINNFKNISNVLEEIAINSLKKNKDKLPSLDEKFYYEESDNLKHLMANLFWCSVCRIPVCLIGPTGLGKTSMARAFSELSRGERGEMFSFNSETKVDDIFGTFTFKNGKLNIIDGTLTKTLEKGNIFIGDEFNLAENTILQTLSIAFENIDENSSYLIPGISKKIKYNKKFFFIACQNDLSTTGRKKLPHIIEKRLRIFDYPMPDLNELIKNCENIIKENEVTIVKNNDRNTDGMTSEIERKFEHISAEKLANFMYEINNKPNKYLGIWSMRNIRKIVRRHSYQQHNIKSYKNVSFELQIVIYILSEVPTNKRKEAFKDVMEILKKTFEIDNENVKNIENVINGVPKIDNDKNKLFLNKGESGIEIEKYFEEFRNLPSFLETLFLAKFANSKEPINFCGPSGYKTFLAKKLTFGADVINLYSETSIDQLLGSINLVNNYESKIYYLEKILKINENEEKFIEYKKIIQDYFDNKLQYENCKDKNKKDEIRKEFFKAEKDFTDLNDNSIMKLNENIKEKIPKCIYLALESLRKKLFEKESEDKGVFKDFTSIFKPGILLEKILVRSPIILKNLSNLSTAVLERFNDLFNYSPKLTLNEDFCDTFTSQMEHKELSNFSDKFRVISISTLAGIRNLSDAAKSRFTTIYTSEYDENERKIVAKNYMNEEKEEKSFHHTPEEFFEFIKEYEMIFKTKLSFLYIIKILSFYKKISEYKKEKKNFNLILAIYFALYSNYDKKNQREKFLKILIKLNKEIKYDIDELTYLITKNDELFKSPLEIEDKKLKSKFTEITVDFIKNVENDETLGKEEIIKDDLLSFSIPFNKLINYIHFSLALNIPLIIEGQIGIGKKTAIKYVANILKLKEIYFSISNTTTVEDLFCKTIPKQTDSGLKFEESRSKFLDAIDCSKNNIENCIIILDNLQDASNNILEALIPVFDETKDKIFLPNGETVSKGKFHIIAIFDDTSKNTNIKNFIPNIIKNSSLLFKCQDFLEKKYLDKINLKIPNLEEFLNDFIKIYNYSKENHKKELFNLNDFAKFKKISEINKNIINYETLLQIILINRFSNSEDVKEISSKFKYSFSKDLWPIISSSKIGNKRYIKIYPIQPKEKDENNNKFFNHELSEDNSYKFEDLKRKMFTLTHEQRIGLIVLMLSVKANIPCIIQGPTASGKSYLIKFFCELLGENPEIITLNNDSGINLLTGQIAPKNEIEYEKKVSIQEAFEEFRDYQEIYSLFIKNNYKKEIKEWKPIPKDFKEIIKNLEEIKKTQSPPDVPRSLKKKETRNKKIDNIEELLKEQLSFLNHLKSEDSPFITALREGKWVILDGIESAEPELYERLSTLCDLNNKSLNLFEKGPQYEYSINNKNDKFKIHENFRLFITYNSYEVEQNKKLSPTFISKCLLYSLSQIDIDCKSSALVLSGLFNYNQTFTEKKEQIEEKINEPPKKNPKNKKKNNKKKKKFQKKEDDSSSSSEEEEESSEDSDDEKEEEKEEEKNDSEEKKSEKNKKEIFEEEGEKYLFKTEKENQRNIILVKRSINELAIRLANVHKKAKEFTQEKIQFFAGQKNFSGRSLKYIYNSINKRNYDLAEGIISVIEDCYSFSYKNPKEMKNELILSFFEDSKNFNEIMSYLGRDEKDISEVCGRLIKIIDDYIEKQIEFNYIAFLDDLDALAFKYLEYFSTKVESALKKLKEKNIISEKYIFLKMIVKILTSIKENINEDNDCAEIKISDLVSNRNEEISSEQNKYLLFRKLIEKKYFNFNMIYKEYDRYIQQIEKEKIENPFFELFIKNNNIVINSIMLGILYSNLEIDEYKYIKLSQIKREMVMVIIELINHCKINFENHKDNIELKIFDNLLFLENSELFFDSFEINYSEEQLMYKVNNEMEKLSKEIYENIKELNYSLNDLAIEEKENLKIIIEKWEKDFKDFKEKIIQIKLKKCGDDNLTKLEADFENLIKELNNLEKDDFIERAIKYLEKMDKTEISLKNSKEFVEAIKNEYINKKNTIINKEALIRFEFKPEDFEENYDLKIINKDYKNKFNKIIYSLIKYNDCLKIVEKLEKSRDKFEQNIYFNQLDKIIYKYNKTKTYKNGLKILRKIIIENNDSISIQYFKDILLSNLLLEYFLIDNSCFYFNIDNIYNEFNNYISRENIDIEDRKLAYFLFNRLSPDYEIIIPSLNINSILILFLQKSYTNYKNGLITYELDINPKADGRNNFQNEVYEFQNLIDTNKMNMIEGLNKFVNICKKTILNRKDIKNRISFEVKGQKPKDFINELYNKLEEILKLEGGKFLEYLIMIIKGIYDSYNRPKKSFELDDLFFIDNEDWKDNIKKYGQYKYLIYYLFKNPDIENDIRKYLSKTDWFLQNDKNKFPIYTHILRILSSKNELSFQGKSFSYTSNLIEKTLKEKILINIEKKEKANNIDWIGLLINNRNTEKYLHNKISYLYNYLYKLNEISSAPSSKFEEQYKSIIEKIIDFFVDCCFKNQIDSIFNKEIKEDKNNIANILFITKLNEIIISEIKNKEKEEYNILKEKTMKFVNKIENTKNELKNIYENLIAAIKKDIEEEKENQRLSMEQAIKIKNENLYENLNEHYIKYDEIFQLLKNNKNLNFSAFNQMVKEILKHKEKLSGYKNIYSNKILEYLIFNIPQGCKKIIVIKYNIEIELNEEDLDFGNYFLPKKYFKDKIKIINENGNQSEKELNQKYNLEGINQSGVTKQLNELFNNSKVNVSKEGIKVSLEIDEKNVDINKKENEDNLLYKVKKISEDIVKLTGKVNFHTRDSFKESSGGNRIIMLLKDLKIKKNDFEKISLKNPRFLNGKKTDLKETKKICEEYEEIKRKLIDEFIDILKYFDIYNNNIENSKKDKEIVSGKYELINKIKILEEKDIDFSKFKGFFYKSKYISLTPKEKKIQTNYEVFNFDLGNIIPSLYGNSIYSLNILSFISQELKTEIIKNSITNKKYQNLFSLSNLLKQNNPLVIKFIIPDIKVEKEEVVETDLNISISGLNPEDIEPQIIKNKFNFHLIPLKIIIFSKKYEFISEGNKLIFNDVLDEGSSFKINFKILNFEGDYDSFYNNYSLISLENNSIDKPKIGFENKETSALFKIKIPKNIDDSKNNFHALFSIYFSQNLIVPIEINSKINKKDFGLFYYNNYNGEIQNHTSNPNLIIYKYVNNNKKNQQRMIQMNLYFRIQCNELLDEKDDTEHNLEIIVPDKNELLSFKPDKDKINFKEGYTIKIQISIDNYSSHKEYENLNKYLKNKKLEIEFICDKTRKKFNLEIKLEKMLESNKNRFCTIPYFIYKKDKFKLLTGKNFDKDTKQNYIYFNYENTNYINEKDKIKYVEGDIKKNAEIEFISEACKLIFIIKDFKKAYNIIIWGPYKQTNKYETFNNSFIELKEINIQKAKKEIEDIYHNFREIKFRSIRKEKTYDEILLKKIKTIEDMKYFVIFICNENLDKNLKIDLLNNLSEYFEKEEKLLVSKVIEDLNNNRNKNILPIIYHNIIFTIGNIIKQRVELLKKYENNYLLILEQILSSKFIKQYDEKKFEAKVKKIFCKSTKEKSKYYQFDEFFQLPKKLDKIPKVKKEKKEEKGNEGIIENEYEIEEHILDNYENLIKNMKTIDDVIEVIKRSYNIAQAFPFLLQKINNKEANKIFRILYSIYKSYIENDKNIISEDSLKFGLLFENLCKKLKNKANLDNFKEIQNLEIDKTESINLYEYPKLKVINIPEEKKWNKELIEKVNTKYFISGKMEKTEEEFVIQPKLNIEEKKNIDKIREKNLRLSNVLPPKEKSEKEQEEIEKEKEIKNDYDEDEEKYMKEDETPKEVYGIKLNKYKDEKYLIKGIIKSMINEKRKKKELIFPDSFDENEEIKEMFLSHSNLDDNLKDPSELILELSQLISIKLLQASVTRNTQTEKICAIIAIDCCRTIEYEYKYHHAVLAFGMMNCLNALEIPYSIVIFADYKFIYTIKEFETPHNDEIYKLVIDCLMIPRYSTRIADLCYYINKKVIHPERSNRRIFLISNGLDPNLRYGELWHKLFENDKDKYCFYFIQPPLEENTDKIKEIWNNFKKETKIEVVIIDELKNIINGEENIYTKFSDILSEKVVLSEEDKKKEQEYLNNIEKNICQPKYKDIVNLDKKIADIFSDLLRYTFDCKDFYILNEPHKASNIDNRLMEKEINIIPHFKIRAVNGEQIIQKLTEFEIKGINRDLIDNIFPPNKPSMYTPSVKGTRLYLVGLVKYMITGGQENKIWLEKKACLKRDYRISIIIDSSISCFNNINTIHSIQTIFTFLKILSIIEIPYFDLIIATDKEPIILSCGNDTTSSLNTKSILWSALVSVLLEKNYNKCNLKDCLLFALKLKSLNLIKRSFIFVLTDGLFDDKDANALKNLISFLEENYISVYGIGLGLFPVKIKNIFSKGFWSGNANNLLNALSIFYGDENSQNGLTTITPIYPKLKDRVEEHIKIIDNYNNYITYRKLFSYLRERTFYLESMEETYNRDEADNTEKNSIINENEYMCSKGQFKGLKVLCCCFWSSDYSDNEKEWIRPEYLKKSFSGGKCLNDAFEFYGIELVIKTKYDECIEELKKGGKYYAAWIICGDGTEKKEIKSNLVSQFIEVLIKFWKNGGALLFWCDNQPLVYEANLFLNEVEFPGDNPKCNIRFVGNHKGDDIMEGGNIGNNKCKIFNNKRRFNKGDYERPSLGHNLLKIYEGITVSFAKIKKIGVDLKERKNEIKEEDLNEPTDETIFPFIPFAYEHEKGLSIIFYPSSDERGDIIIDGGFSKLFNQEEMQKAGTYRYILNCISWTTQFSKRIKDKGDSWVENFNLPSFDYDIRLDEKHEFREEKSSKDVDIIYLIDATGSMGKEIKAAKEQVINILNELKNKYPDFSFNFGSIFYRDKIDSPSDENCFFPLTDNIQVLKEKISTIRAYGGGDIPEDWVWGYKTAVENVGWRKGTKLIIHIADAGAHGPEFSVDDHYDKEGPKLKKYIERCVENNIKIIGLMIYEHAKNSFKKVMNIYNEHKSKIRGKNQMIDMKNFNRGSNVDISSQFKDLVIKATAAAVPKK